MIEQKLLDRLVAVATELIHSATVRAEPWPDGARLTVDWAWIEVGLPDAERLHRGSKMAGRAAVYTHRDVDQLLAQYAGKKIHGAADIPIYALHRRFVEEVAALIDRRSSLALSITDRELYVTIGNRTLSSPLVEHRIG